MPAAQRTCGERAPRISDDVWAKYKDKIRTLWKDQGLTVDEVLRNLEQNDGFRPRQVSVATRSQSRGWTRLILTATQPAAVQSSTQ